MVLFYRLLIIVKAWMVPNLPCTQGGYLPLSEGSGFADGFSTLLRLVSLGRRGFCVFARHFLPDK
jgi:hypothetical protein